MHKDIFILRLMQKLRIYKAQETTNFSKKETKIVKNQM